MRATHPGIQPEATQRATLRFFFQAEDGIRDYKVTGVQTCALPISYAGAVGYFSYNGNADFAIAIRTLFRRGRVGYLQAGAGIVADSVPSKEWLERSEERRGGEEGRSRWLPDH